MPNRNQLNMQMYDNTKKISKQKTIITTTTCLSLGMFTGLLGPSIPFFTQNMFTQISTILWVLVVKTIGFILANVVSSYLYYWFNVCCLLGLSCLSISFCICLLPFIIDLTTFCLTSLILGFSLSLLYNGIDAFYNHLWSRPSTLSIRWLNFTVALGAIFSTLLLYPSTLSASEEIFPVNQTIFPFRYRRSILNHTAENLSATNISVQYHLKPSTADSDKDDLFENYFYLKIHYYLSSITSIHLVYLFVALLFFLLSIFYSLLALQNNDTNLSSIVNLKPITFPFLKSYELTNNRNNLAIMPLNRSIMKHLCFMLLFLFILSSIESTCLYLTYLFGKMKQFSFTQCLIIQLSYYIGRLIDLCLNNIWFSFKQYKKLQIKFISIKFIIFIRLILLTIVCFTNTFNQFYNFIFFSIGLCLTSLPNLIFNFIERNFILSKIWYQSISTVILFAEMILPIIFVIKIQYFIDYYLKILLVFLLILFPIVIYSSKQVQIYNLYQLLPKTIQMNNNNSQNST